MKKTNIDYNEQSVFRLHLVHFGTIGKGYGYNIKELMDWPYTAFILPDKMTVEEAFKILSYLTQKIESDLKLPECSHMAVTALNKNLSQFHFKTLPDYKNTTVDLFTITGDMKRFKKSEYANVYFDWFTENVSFEEAKTIYHKYGYTFNEPKFTIKQE